MAASLAPASAAGSQTPTGVTNSAAWASAARSSRSPMMPKPMMPRAMGAGMGLLRGVGRGDYCPAQCPAMAHTRFTSQKAKTSEIGSVMLRR
jgi:hypothetical protein